MATVSQNVSVKDNKIMRAFVLKQPFYVLQNSVKLEVHYKNIVILMVHFVQNIGHSVNLCHNCTNNISGKATMFEH